jgi:hypothetical protein
VAKRFSKDEGRACSKNSFSTISFDLFCFAVLLLIPGVAKQFESKGLWSS